jgi:hypothetical protein
VSRTRFRKSAKPFVTSWRTSCGPAIGLSSRPTPRAHASSDSVYSTSQLKLRPLGGTKAIIILTDGLDSGSLHALNPTIGELQASGTVVCAIKVGDWRAALMHGLDRLAQFTATPASIPFESGYYHPGASDGIAH